VDINGPAAYHYFLTPYFIQDDLPFEDLVRFGRQQGEQFKFLPRQDELFTVIDHFVFFPVDHQVPYLQDLTGFLFSLFQSPEQGLYLTEKNLGFDRFGNVIIRTCIETRNLGIVFVPGGEKGYDRILQSPGPSDEFTGLYPIHFGHHDIKDNEVRQFFLRFFHTFRPVLCRKHLISLSRVIIAQDFQDIGFVIHQKNFDVLLFHKIGVRLIPSKITIFKRRAH